MKKAKILLVVGLVASLLGFSMVVFNFPVLDGSLSKADGFVQGFLCGLGPVMCLAAFLRYKEVKDNQA